MSKILYDEQPMVVDKVLARKLGLNEAIVVQQIHYWLKTNEKNNHNYINGRYWTYNTLAEWHESNFDFWSLDTVKRTFTKLENMEILLVSNFNKDRRDRTKWYSINYEKLEELIASDSGKNNNRKSAICTNATEDIKPQCKSTNCTNAISDSNQHCKSAICPNAKVQFAPTQEGNLHHTIPETTTEITNREYQSINPSGTIDQNAKTENDGQMDLTDETLEVETEEQSLNFNSKEELLDYLKNKHGATEDQIIRGIKKTKKLEDQGKVKNFRAYLSKVIETIKTDDLTKSLDTLKGGDLAELARQKRKKQLYESLYQN